MALYYVDASALVKLVRDEAESDSLRAFVTDAGLVSSNVVEAEVPRAVRRAVADNPALPLDRLLERGEKVLEATALRAVDHELLIDAGALTEPALRALDAIHVATAIDLQPIDAFVTYDVRQAAVARLAGLRTMAPGS